MNVSNIMTLAQFLEELPEHNDRKLDMSCWIWEDECDTTACIGGWAWLLFKKDCGQFNGYTRYAAKSLGITVDQARDLCKRFPGWDHVDGGIADQITPDHAAKVLRNLAETGEVDWSPIAEELGVTA